jgi:hypothetical protein
MMPMVNISNDPFRQRSTSIINSNDQPKWSTSMSNAHDQHRWSISMVNAHYQHQWSSIPMLININARRRLTSMIKPNGQFQGPINVNEQHEMPMISTNDQYQWS